MRKYIVLVSLIFNLGSYAQLSRSQQAGIDALFQTWDQRSSPGAALGIVKDGKLVYARGYGVADLEHDVPITDSSIFYIGSVSKQFVALCILLLEEQGKLSLDDPVQKYLPDFPDYGTPLTIRNFIHHTSGVRDNLTLWALAGNDYLDHIDKDEMYRLICRQKELNFRPGEKYLYSNSCYFMLGLIIEKVSGESLHDFGQKNIFMPLGMNHTFFGDDNTRIIRNRAFSYIQDSGTYRNQIMRYDLVGSGGIYSNIKDLYLWDQNFYHNKLGKGSQGLIEKMHTEGILNNGKSCGYAFAIQNGVYRGLKTVSHGGALASYRSYLLRFPEQEFSVIILANVTPIPINELPYKVADILLEKQLGPPPAVEKSGEKRSQANETPGNFALANPGQYAGSFYSEELDVSYLISLKGNQLYCSINNKKPEVLQPVKPDLFELDEYIKVNFTRSNGGLVNGFTVDAGRVTNLKFRRM